MITKRSKPHQSSNFDFLASRFMIPLPNLGLFSYLESFYPVYSTIWWHLAKKKWKTKK